MNSKQKFTSFGFRSRMVVLFGFVFFLFFSVAATMIYFNVKEILVGNTNRALGERAKLLLDRSNLDPAVIPLPATEEVMRIAGNLYRKDTILFESQFFPASLNKNDTKIQIINGWRIATAFREENTEDILRVWVGRKDEPLQEQLQLVFNALLISILISLFVSMAIAYLISALIMQPLNRISRQIKNFDYKAGFTPISHLPYKDEISTIITSINQMMQRIADNFRIQNNFFGAASHELRTPLSILTTSMQVQVQQGNEEVKKLLLPHLEEVNRLSRLVDDLLTLSALRNDLVKIHLTETDIIELLLKTTEMFDLKIKQHGLFVSLNLMDETKDHIVMADPEKILQVFINLMDNAVKYAVYNTVISIKISAPENIIVSFTNETNKNIQGSQQLSNEFFQEDILQDGYGLGLWISQQLLDMQGILMELKNKKHCFTAQLYFKNVVN